MRAAGDVSASPSPRSTFLGPPQIFPESWSLPKWFGAFISIGAQAQGLHLQDLPTLEDLQQYLMLSVNDDDFLVCP